MNKLKSSGFIIFGRMHFLKILLLSSMTIAQNPLDQVISEVREMHGNPHGNYLIQFTNQHIGNWIVNCSQSFGPNQEIPLVKDDRAHLQNVLNSLNSTHFNLNAVHKHKGYLCDISLNHSQTMRNYIRERLRLSYSRKGNIQPLTLELNVKGSFPIYKRFQVVDISREGLFKQLPYKLQHLLSTLSLTLKEQGLDPRPPAYEISVSDGCLTSSVHKRQVQTDEQENENVTKVESVKGRTPGVKADLIDIINHLLMFTIHTQDMLFKVCEHSLMDFNREICNMDSYYSTHDGHYVIKECCSLQKAYSKPYELPSLSNTLTWSCHDPYYVTRLLGTMAIAISYLSVALCPLVIKWVIPHSLTARISKKR